MIKSTLVLILLSSVSNLMAQKKFNLYLEASPNHSARTYIDDGLLKGERDKPMFGYSYSAKLGYEITSSFGMSTGLEYNNKGFRIEGIYFTKTGIQVVTNSLDLNFIEVPLYFRYRILNKKIRITQTVGLSYGRLRKLTIHFDGDKESLTKKEIDDETAFNRDVANFHFGIEFSHQIDENLSLKIEPKFDYTIDPILKNGFDHLYIFGVNIGVVIGL